MTQEQKENREKAERAKIALFDTESDAALYLAWLVVFNESKEYAEKVLNTSLA